MLQNLLTLVISVFIAIQPSYLYAEATTVDSGVVDYSYQEQEMAAIPVAVVILMGVGMAIVRTQVVRSLSRAAAKKAASNFVKGQMKKVGQNAKKRCFSIRGSQSARVLLGADRKTVLWAGDSHKVYEREVQKHCN